jgi:hypothetical protein
MLKRRRPVVMPHTSTVTYPSALFSLERDEVLPYERFAYNVLGIAIEALHAKALPERVVIDFSATTVNTPAWLMNVSVTCELGADAIPIAFRFSIPELVPALIYGYCFSCAAQLVEGDLAGIRESVQKFLDAASAGVREYKTSGLGPVRCC